ncbi:MAG: hypothetical protein JRI72_16355 [Deltaproteobacteria bacterium]|nr:hypothetical protein [Deltaproteobacteria bacterium]
MRSYTEEQIRKAQSQNKQIWKLETGNAGEDDFLIGSYEEVLNDVLVHFEEKALPEDWEIIPVDWQI